MEPFNKELFKLLWHRSLGPAYPPKPLIRRHLCRWLGHGDYFTGWLNQRTCGYCWKPIFDDFKLPKVGDTVTIKMPARWAEANRGPSK